MNVRVTPGTDTPPCLLLLACCLSLPAAAAALQMMLDGHVYLNVDSQHIQQSSPRLLTATVEVPDDMINIWEVQVNK